MRSGAASTPGSGQGSGGYRRLEKVPVQILRLGSGRFWCEVAQGSVAEPGVSNALDARNSCVLKLIAMFRNGLLRPVDHTGRVFL